jgi:hypothetical protein
VWCVLLATHASVFLAAFFRYDFSAIVPPSTRSSAERSGIEQYTRSEARLRGTVQTCTCAARVRITRHGWCVIIATPHFRLRVREVYPQEVYPQEIPNAIYVLIHVVYMILKAESWRSTESWKLKAEYRCATARVMHLSPAVWCVYRDSHGPYITCATAATP